MSTKASPPTILRRQGEGASAGETGEATILFTDIAGFTTIAEYLAPHELVAALNDYLETVLEPIRAHGGVVNTFIGDGLFASFNMPLACEDHAVRRGAGGDRHPARRRQPHLRRPGRGARHPDRHQHRPCDRRLGRRRPAPELHPAGRHGESRGAAGGS